MRIVFIGASSLGYKCCEAIINSKNNVVGILTLGDEFSIKYSNQKERINVKNYLHKDFNDFKIRYNIPVITAKQPMAKAYLNINQWQPDLIIVVGWYYMIPELVLKYPSKGVIAIHASLLPKYRGNAPLVWAMINGEKRTGVTLFYIKNGIDEGDIIAQTIFDILEDDYISNVLVKAEISSIQLLIQYLPLIANNSAPRLIQDSSEATYFPKRNPDDGMIDWNWEENKIRNFIRAQSRPYPGAFTILGNKKVIIWDADIKSLNK